MCLLSCSNKDIKMLPSIYDINELSSTRVPSSKVILYQINDRVLKQDLVNYPVDKWPHDGWNVSTWKTIQSMPERLDIIGFLKNELIKYSSETNKQGTHLIRQLINRLTEKEGAYLISYFYKSKPGSNDFSEHEWLYLFVLNSNTGQLVCITNAFR